MPLLNSSALTFERSILERFLSKVSVEPSGCWRWADAPSGNGYGYLGIGGRRGRKIQAHRLSYEFWRGPILPTHQIDHLCRHRWCVNPAHLEAVTQRVNLLRGFGASAVNAKKVECLGGHPLIGPDADIHVDSLGRRVCRPCRRIRDRRRRRHACHL